RRGGSRVGPGLGPALMSKNQSKRTKRPGRRSRIRFLSRSQQNRPDKSAATDRGRLGFFKVHTSPAAPAGEPECSAGGGAVTVAVCLRVCAGHGRGARGVPARAPREK